MFLKKKCVYIIKTHLKNANENKNIKKYNYFKTMLFRFDSKSCKNICSKILIDFEIMSAVQNKKSPL